MDIDWIEDKNYKVLTESEAYKYGQLNVYLIKKFTDIPKYIGSYDLNPYILTIEIMKSFGNHIAKQLSTKSNTRTYTHRRKNNLYLS